MDLRDKNFWNGTNDKLNASSCCEYFSVSRGIAFIESSNLVIHTIIGCPLLSFVVYANTSALFVRSVAMK